MKTRIAFPVMCFVVPLALMSAVSAQEQAEQPTPIIEIFGCTYNGNSDLADLSAVAARWNDWADERNITDYTAFIASPYLHSDQLAYEVLWIGGWPSGAAMGTGEAIYLSEGQDIEADFSTVVDCAAHAQYAEVVIHAPGGPAPENPIAVFSDCTVHEGRTDEEALIALGQWSEHMVANGGNDFMAALFPVAGESPDAEYSFKTIEGYESMQAYGRALDVVTRGGYRRAGELFGRLLDCNSPRVYLLDRVRASTLTP